METKICSKCKLEKQLYDFHNNKTNKGGKHCQCKSCTKLNYKYNKKIPIINLEESIEKKKTTLL